jgi:hypothetical protein
MSDRSPDSAAIVLDGSFRELTEAIEGLSELDFDRFPEGFAELLFQRLVDIRKSFRDWVVPIEAGPAMPASQPAQCTFGLHPPPRDADLLAALRTRDVGLIVSHLRTPVVVSRPTPTTGGSRMSSI